MTERKAAIVLAAGKGKRMKSDLPKVVHCIDDRPIISILMDTLVTTNFDRIIVVVGHKGEMVEEALAGYPVSFVWQKEQLGTGHAVMMTREHMADFDGTVLVILGDVPFLSTASIERLLEIHRSTGAKATCLSAIIDDPTGYGRIVREGDSDALKAIVEDADASDDVLRIKEINSGTFCFNSKALFEALEQIDNDNRQEEYYLTDCVKIMYSNGLPVSVVTAENPDEVLGVNSLEQLDSLARKFASKEQTN